jgi:thymidylate synthase
MELYNSCSNRVEDFAKASKFWEKIANPDGTINSAYGYLIWENKSCGNENYEYTKKRSFEDGGISIRAQSIYRTPYEWCLESLKADKDTRQAVLRFSLPEHHWQGNKDFVCTMHANFMIRNDMLNMCVVMRSNDLCKGLVYDICFFCSIMDKLIVDLKDTYPNLSKGSYTHMAHSLHAYERDFPIIRKMLGE